jgi:hypothetical protein
MAVPFFASVTIYRQSPSAAIKRTETAADCRTLQNGFLFCFLFFNPDRLFLIEVRKLKGQRLIFVQQIDKKRGPLNLYSRNHFIGR